MEKWLSMRIMTQAYRRSTLSIIRGVFESGEWSGHLINTHHPASKIDMDEIYYVVRELSPTIGNKLKIDSSNMNKFPDIQKAFF